MVLTTAAGILAACGTSIIAGANLFSGWRQRKFQEKEGFRQREFQEKLQEQQFQFQAAMQENNLRRAEILQRDIVKWQFETALELQRSNFERQSALWEQSVFYNQWPLMASPKQYVNERLTTYKTDRVPLQILVPSSLSDRILELGDLMKSAYSMGSNSPIYYYDGGWKNCPTVRGTALLSTLYSVLKGLPTLVMIPQGSFRDNMSIEIGYWGLGEQNDTPTLTKIVTFDMYKLELDLIRQYADNMIELYRNEKDKIANDINVTVRRDELARRSELESMGEAPLDIERKLSNEFASKYQRKPIEKELELQKQKVIGSVLEVVCAGYSDIYHMLEFKTPPNAPLLAGTNPLFADNRVRAMLVDMYAAAIKSISRDSKTRLLDYPLCAALVAKSVYDAGWKSEAERFGEESKNALLDIYRDKTDNVMTSHCEAMKILMDCGIANGNSRIAYIADDKYLVSDETNLFSGNKKEALKQANEKIRLKKYSDAISILKQFNDDCEVLATLGLLHMKGLGCDEDKAEGMRLLSRAAELGSCRACCQLYFELRGTNKPAAIKFLKQASDKDYWDALYILADEYRQIGRFSLMEKLYVRGAQLGDPRAVKKLRNLKKG